MRGQLTPQLLYQWIRCKRSCVCARTNTHVCARARSVWVMCPCVCVCVYPSTTCILDEFCASCSGPAQQARHHTHHIMGSKSMRGNPTLLSSPARTITTTPTFRSRLAPGSPICAVVSAAPRRRILHFGHSGRDRVPFLYFVNASSAFIEAAATH